MSNLVKKETTQKVNIAALKTLALSKNQCRQLKGGDGIIVQDVVIH